jgi:universal stress protein E
MSPEFFLIVVDSAHSEHLALNRIVNFAGRQRHSSMSVHVFAGFESDDLSTPDRPMEVIREPSWLEDLLVPLKNSGVKFTAELFWTRNWETSIINAARRTEAELIVISQSSATNKTGITDSIWSLLRNSEIPVLTIEPGAPAKRENILAAVNMQTTDDEYDALNRKVLLHGQMLADFYDAKLHVVNAYYDSEDYPDRDKVRRIVDISRQDIHVDMGKPEEIIAKVTKQLHADLVVMGTMARRGIRATLRRNTSEKIIESLAVDVLTLN